MRNAIERGYSPRDKEPHWSPYPGSVTVDSLQKGQSAYIFPRNKENLLAFKGHIAKVTSQGDAVMRLESFGLGKKPGEYVSLGSGTCAYLEKPPQAVYLEI